MADAVTEELSAATPDDHVSCSSAAACTDQIPPATFHSVDTAQFQQLFQEANRCAWDSISSDKILNIKTSKFGRELSEISDFLADSSRDTLIQCCAITEPLKQAFVNKPFSSQTDRDEFMRHVHELQLSSNAVDSFYSFLRSCIPDVQLQTAIMMYQVWLRKFVEAMLGKISIMQQRVENNTCMVNKLTNTDNNVLYYISGYLCTKIKSSVRRYKTLRNHEQLANSLSTKNPTNFDNFFIQYQKWVQKQNRGGLSYPTRDFFLLVVELDSIYRQQLLSVGLAHLPNKQQLKQIILERQNIHLIWRRMLQQVEGCTAESTQRILELIVCLFITLKGFAVAKQQCFKLKSMRDSKSLRGKLKKSK